MNEYPFRARPAFAIWTKVINPCIPWNTMSKVKHRWIVHYMTVSIYTVVWWFGSMVGPDGKLYHRGVVGRGGLQLWAYVLSDYFMVEGQHRKLLCRGVWKPLIYSLGQCTRYRAKISIDPYSNVNILWFQRKDMRIAEQFLWIFLTFFFYRFSVAIVWLQRLFSLKKKDRRYEHTLFLS